MCDGQGCVLLAATRVDGLVIPEKGWGTFHHVLCVVLCQVSLVSTVGQKLLPVGWDSNICPHLVEMTLALASFPTGLGLDDVFHVLVKHHVYLLVDFK